MIGAPGAGLKPQIKSSLTSIVTIRLRISLTIRSRKGGRGIGLPGESLNQEEAFGGTVLEDEKTG